MFVISVAVEDFVFFLSDCTFGLVIMLARRHVSPADHPRDVTPSITVLHHGLLHTMGGQG